MSTGLPTSRDSAESQSQHIPALDGLRAIAILAVFMFHTVRGSVVQGPLSKGLLAAATGGWMGVDLFFVLSGFLITGILLDTRGAGGYYRAFVVRRALRILPLYYVTLLLLVGLAALLPGTAGVEGAKLRAVQGWYWAHLVNGLVARDGFTGAPLQTGHFWSLAVEEQFYLLWPLVVAFCSPARLRRVCVALIGIALAVRIGLVGWAHADTASAAYVLPFARLDSLALGAWLAAVARQPGGVAAAWPQIRRFGVLGLGVLVGVALWTHTLHWTSAPMQTIGYTAVAFVAAAMLAFVLNVAAGPLPRVLAARPVVYVGKRSYALYVLHYPLIALASHAGITGGSVSERVGSQALGLVAFMLALFAVSLALSELSWVAIERPCLALKERIAPRPARTRGPANELTAEPVGAPSERTGPELSQAR